MYSMAEEESVPPLKARRLKELSVHVYADLCYMYLSAFKTLWPL